MNQLTKIKLTKIVNQSCRKFWEYSNLGGCCAIASRALVYYFDYFFPNNYNKFVYGYYEESYNHHCWVQSGNIIYDPTIKQFDKKRQIAIANEDGDMYVRKVEINIYDSENVINFFKGWPEHQMPISDNVIRVQQIADKILKINP